tara:strand:+ start:6598 stop:6744 length:147 start_codon:yes stop_codon:yes gene_type:complete
MTKQKFKQLRIDEEAEKITVLQAMIKSKSSSIKPSESGDKPSTKQSWD